MMKIALRHPSGLEIEFEGDEEAFERFASFLSGDLGSFVAALEPASNTGHQDGDEDVTPDPSHDEDDKEDTTPNDPLDPGLLAERFERVGATSDIERVAVMAQAAAEAGREGLDSALASALYDLMGVPQPSRWSKAFSNTKARGLVRSVKYGVWAPTVNGQNYAKYGTKPLIQRRARRPSSGNGESPRLALDPGDGTERDD